MNIEERRHGIQLPFNFIMAEIEQEIIQSRGTMERRLFLSRRPAAGNRALSVPKLHSSAEFWSRIFN